MLYLPDVPPSSTLAAGMPAIVDLLRQAEAIIPVSGVTERNQIGALLNPSPENPVFVRRADTGGIEENAGAGWHSINPTNYRSGAPDGGTFTSSRLVLACPIPAAPFARLVHARATIYGTNIAGTWDAALSGLVPNWLDSPFFSRYSGSQGTAIVDGEFTLAAGEQTVLRGWVGYRSGGNQTFTASADAKYSRIVATVFRAG